MNIFFTGLLNSSGSEGPLDDDASSYRPAEEKNVEETTKGREDNFKEQCRDHGELQKNKIKLKNNTKNYSTIRSSGRKKEAKMAR